MSLALHLSWSILWFRIHSFWALPTHFVVLGKASLSLSSCGHGMFNLLSRDCLSRWRQLGASRRKGAKDFWTLWGRSYDVFATQGAVQTGKSQCEAGSAHQNSLTENNLRGRPLAFNFLWHHLLFIPDCSRQDRGLWTSGKSPVCSTYLIQGVLGSQLYDTGFTWVLGIWAQILRPVGYSSLYPLSHLLRSCSTTPLSKVWKCSGKSGKGNGQKLPRESSAWPWGRLAWERERRGKQQE